MSTQYTVFENHNGKIILDERSCTFDLDVEINEPSVLNGEGVVGQSLATALSESEVIDMAVNLLGPLHYFNPGPEIMDAVMAKLKERGYT